MSTLYANLGERANANGLSELNVASCPLFSSPLLEGNAQHYVAVMGRPDGGKSNVWGNSPRFTSTPNEESMAHKHILSRCHTRFRFGSRLTG